MRGTEGASEFATFTDSIIIGKRHPIKSALLLNNRSKLPDLAISRGSWMIGKLSFSPSAHCLRRIALMQSIMKEITIKKDPHAKHGTSQARISFGVSTAPEPV